MVASVRYRIVLKAAAYVAYGEEVFLCRGSRSLSEHADTGESYSKNRQ